MMVILIAITWLFWLVLLPVIIARSDRPDRRRTDPVPAAWIVREPMTYTQSLEAIPTLAHHTARVMCRNGHVIPSGTWCYECEGRARQCSVCTHPPEAPCP